MSEQVQGNKEKGGDGKRHKFVQTILEPSVHKALALIALDKEISLTSLIREILTEYIEGENYGRRS